jgi:hypothetical protein
MLIIKKNNNKKRLRPPVTRLQTCDLPLMAARYSPSRTQSEPMLVLELIHIVSPQLFNKIELIDHDQCPTVGMGGEEPANFATPTIP